MEKKFRLNHYDWHDEVIFKMDNKRLYRTSVDNEFASFENSGRCLNIYWDKWDSEIFIYHDDPNIFFKAEKIVLEQKNGRSLIEFKPITGRTHQLRVHAAHHLGLNCPIVGDDLYGLRNSRLHLHASELTIFHPILKREIYLNNEYNYCTPSP